MDPKLSLGRQGRGKVEDRPGKKLASPIETEAFDQIVFWSLFKFNQLDGNYRMT